MFLAEVTGF